MAVGLLCEEVTRLRDLHTCTRNSIILYFVMQECV